MMQWILAPVVVVVAIVVTAPWWVTLLESLTGCEDDYETRIESRNGHVPPRARPSEEELKARFERLASKDGFVHQLANATDPSVREQGEPHDSRAIVERSRRHGAAVLDTILNASKGLIR